MALNFFQKVEQEKIVPSATSMSNLDESFITSSMYSSGSKILRSSRTSGQDESASTDSGDDDFSSVRSVDVTTASFTSKDSEASDDEKSLSPRSSDLNVATCVYSVMFLLNFRATCCGQSGTEQKSALGYRTEAAPQNETCPSTSSPKSCAKSFRSGRQQSNELAFERLPQKALPSSTADSWVAKQRAKAAPDDENTKVLRATRSILNKLTIEKFESLFDQLVACGIKTPQHVSMLMREVFEKATTQHQFIPMYAELCVKLERDPHIASAVKQANEQHDFRHLLLDACQSAFEQLLEPCGADDAAEEESQIRRKQQALGNIKLVGELLVQGMLSASLLVECGKTLLQNRKTCPEALESLAALVMVAGPHFDKKDWQYHSSLEALFSDMNDLTKDKSTPPRTRFLLRDVLDIRKAGWCTSVNQAAVKAAPMKLQEVHRKASEELSAGVGSPKRLNSLVAICQRPTSGNTATMNEEAKGGVRKKLQLSPKGASKQGPPKQNNNSKFTGSELASLLGKSFQAGQQASTNGEIVEIKAPLEPAQGPVTYQSAMVTTRVVEDFDIVGFRRALSATITKLALDRNVPAAVQYIRLQEVPIQFQAEEFCDIISRIVEEKRGAVRRCEFAFAAGLMSTEQSPFDRSACLEGIRLFFQDVYADLCNEVPRLPAIMRSEFVPTMSSVLQTVELHKVLPKDMRAQA